MEIKRGDIYMTQLGDYSGSIQGGTRPCLVISNNLCNKHSPVLVVAPLTTKKKKKLCTHVHIVGYGLRESSLILLEQITTVRREQLERKITSIHGTVYENQVDEAIKKQLAL